MVLSRWRHRSAGRGTARQRVKIMCLVVVGASLATVLLVRFARPGVAATCSQHVVQAWTSSTNGSQQHYGVKAATGIWVPSNPASPSCTRVSSLIDVRNSSNWVEVGWFMDPAEVNSCGTYPVGDSNPRQFTMYVKDGIGHCPSGTPPIWNPTGGYEPANVHETDPANCTPISNTYEWDVNSTPVWTVTNKVSFCLGESITNGERVSTADGMDTTRSDFAGLMINGASGNFAYWTDSSLCADTDDRFDNQYDSARHVEVVAGTTTWDSTPCY